jgi:hypothetical protein
MTRGLPHLYKLCEIVNPESRAEMTPPMSYTGHVVGIDERILTTVSSINLELYVNFFRVGIIR